MATRLISQEQVSAACEEGSKAGERPTTLNIHKMLGRGSYSTVKKYIDVWMQSDSAKEAQAAQLPSVIELPEEFKEESEHFLKKVFQIAESQASAKVEQIRAERDQAVLAAEDQAKQAV